MIEESLKTEAKGKLVALRKVFADPAISLETVKQRIDDFQQTLFAIGTSVYKQANPEQNEFTVTPDSDITSQIEKGSQSTMSEEDFNLNVGEENTVTVDYEAIE